MTFREFEKLFKSKYPEGDVTAHGKFGGTERNNKTTVVFGRGGKCYEYYGAYEDILCRCGIKVISKSRLRDIECALERYKKWDGKVSLFGTVCNHKQDIARLEEELKNIHKNYIVVR